jgi:hypothetical protein
MYGQNFGDWLQGCLHYCHGDTVVVVRVDDSPPMGPFCSVPLSVKLWSA